MKFSAKQQEGVKLCALSLPTFFTPFTLQIMRISLLVFVFRLLACSCFLVLRLKVKT